MKVVTLKRLNSALADVIHDFACLDIWNERMYSVDVFLVPAGAAYGYKYNGRKGHIEIPAISLSRIGQKYLGFGSHFGLRDLLRHEFGHAVADCYPRLSRSRRFIRAFGGSYDRASSVMPYDPAHHVTQYAATDPAEDFCEVFMYFVKYRGTLPVRFNTPVIKLKWGFVSRMLSAIRKGSHTMI